MSEPLYMLLELHPDHLTQDSESGWPIRTYTTKDRAIEDQKLLADVAADRHFAVVAIPHIDA